MSEKLLLATEQLKRFAEFRDGLFIDCCDLQTTAALDPHVRGVAADDAPQILKAWWRLYQDVNTSFRRRGIGGTDVVESPFDLPKGKRIKDCVSWLKHKQAQAEKTLTKLAAEKDKATYKRDRKPLNILMNGWNIQRLRATALLTKLEAAYKGTDKPLADIAREARKLRGARPAR